MNSSIWRTLMRSSFALRYVNVAGTDTRVLDGGLQDQSALILLHGTGGHLEAYTHNYHELGKSLRVVGYDLVGHGYTDKPDIPYTIDVYVRHLIGLLDELNLDQVVLSGESLGALISAWTAVQYPGRVRGLVLNTPGNVANNQQTMQEIRRLTRDAVYECTREKVRQRLEWLFYDTSQLSDELIDIRYDIYSQPGFETAIDNILVLQNMETRAAYAWNRDWLSGICCPTSIVWTSHDPSGSIEDGMMLNEWIPGSEFVIIDSAGHWPQWEQPARFNQLNLDFVKSLSRK